MAGSIVATYRQIVSYGKEIVGSFKQLRHDAPRRLDRGAAINIYNKTRASIHPNALMMGDQYQRLINILFSVDPPKVFILKLKAVLKHKGAKAPPPGSIGSPIAVYNKTGNFLVIYEHATASHQELFSTVMHELRHLLVETRGAVKPLDLNRQADRAYILRKYGDQISDKSLDSLIKRRIDGVYPDHRRESEIDAAIIDEIATQLYPIFMRSDLSEKTALVYQLLIALQGGLFPAIPNAA